MSNARTLANLVPDGLDDYEEGTWAPSIAGENAISSVTINTDAIYTKIGSAVRVTFEFSGSVTSGSEVLVDFTLPFLAHSTAYTDVGIAPFLVGSGANRFGVGSIFRGSAVNNKMYVYIASREVQTSGALTCRVTLTYKAV